MPEYLSPGVYVEEIDAGPRPIVGVPSSTAGMVGVTVRGPTAGSPRLVSSFLEFQRTFGGFVPEPDRAIADVLGTDPDEGGRWWQFPLAVRGFFDNGGQRLFVKRVLPSTARAASGMLGRGLIIELARDAKHSDTTIQLRELVGIANTSTMRILRGDTGQEIDPNDFTVNSYDAVKKTITLDRPVGVELKAGRDFVRVGARSATPVPAAEESLRFDAKAKGDWGNALQVRVRPMVGATMSILADAGQGAAFATRLTADAAANSPTIDVETVAGLDRQAGPPVVITPPTPFLVEIDGRRFQVAADADVVPVPGQATQLRLTLTDPAGALAHPAWRTGLPVRRVRLANPGAATDTLRVSGVARLYVGAVVELEQDSSKEVRTVTAITDDRVQFDANVAAGYRENHRVHVIEAEVSARYQDDAGDLVEETFPNLRLAPVDHPLDLERAVNERSQLVQVARRPNLSLDPTRFPTAPTGPNPPFNGWLVLTNGADLLDQLTVDDFVGENRGDGLRTGIQALEDIDEVAICAVPGMWAGTVQGALIQHCEELKDRFAILDPQDGLDLAGIQGFRNRYNTRYAALYYPWLVGRDPSVDRDVHLPPSGHMAGVYARVDIERGVHKAPANVVLRGIKVGEGDGFVERITKRHQDGLNPRGINAFRFFPGYGQLVWGARTLTSASDAQWRYINVRRLFIMIEESIDEGTQWVVFEPNDEPLWALVRQSVANFLTTVWRTGALAGKTPDEAFFVACDRTTMTQDDIDQGRLICVIGIAPVFPAEFVIFRIQQKTRELAAV